MKTCLFILALATSTLGFAQQNIDEMLAKFNKGSVAYITAQQLAKLNENDKPVILLDARETAEYQTSHLPGAINVGYRNFNAEQLTALNLNLDATVVVYCTIGVRSENIGERLQRLGYKNVNNLKGGIVSWKNSGYQVMDSTNQTTQEVHVYGRRWEKWLTNGIPTYD